jgi:hypothetical protein
LEVALILDIILLIPLESSSDSDAALAPLLLCLSGVVYFVYFYLRYRNTDKRHHHERETISSTANLREYNELVKHRTRIRSSEMDGRNDEEVEGTLSRGNERLTGFIKATNISELLND